MNAQQIIDQVAAEEARKKELTDSFYPKRTKYTAEQVKILTNDAYRLEYYKHHFLGFENE